MKLLPWFCAVVLGLLAHITYVNALFGARYNQRDRDMGRDYTEPQPNHGDWYCGTGRLTVVSSKFSIRWFCGKQALDPVNQCCKMHDGCYLNQRDSRVVCDSNFFGCIHPKMESCSWTEWWMVKAVERYGDVYYDERTKELQEMKAQEAAAMAAEEKFMAELAAKQNATYGGAAGRLYGAHQ